jgi:hypothetical protein
MTKSELKYNVEQTGSYFFTSKTMKFFGDTMKNYGVRSTTIDTYTQEKIDCWELYRIHPVKHGLSDSAYFDKVTFERHYVKR